MFVRAPMEPRLLAFVSLAFVLGCTEEPSSDRSGVDGGSLGVDGGAGADAGPVNGDDAGLVDGVDAGVAGGGCPPTGPFGTAAGDIAPDVMLLDCDDNPVSLHETLCEAEVGWVFEYAEWCPPCRSFARDDVENIWQAHRDQGLQALVVVSADASYDAPTAELCAEVKDRYGLTMPVLYDPTGALQEGLDVASNAVDVVFSPGVRIEWKGRYDSAQVDDQISAVLE